jgi:hypothetical protein
VAFYIVFFFAIMKAFRGKMRNYAEFDFGPGLRKLSMKKEITKLMKKSLKQLKRTCECYMVLTTNTYNNGIRQGDDTFSKRDTSHVTVVRQKNNLACSCR